MGFLRKAIILSTGGLAPIKAQSYKERAAKAAEGQLRLQQQTLSESQQPGASLWNVTCPYCKWYSFLAPIGDNIECPKCGERMSVRRGVLRTRAVKIPPQHEHAEASEEAQRQAEDHHQPSTTDTADDLERLADLHRRGALTDEEFVAAKAKILGT